VSHVKVAYENSRVALTCASQPVGLREVI